MPGIILISSAYLPPAEYFSLICEAGEVLIEKEENYLKQSYRNRSYIQSAHGIQLLSVPVYEGSRRKIPMKDIRIDYSKRWQQVHIGALRASYSASPFFEFYFSEIEHIIMNNFTYLLDLNMELTSLLASQIKIEKVLTFTTFFSPAEGTGYDFRYSLSPKKESLYRPENYIRVFNSGSCIDPRLSIIDLIFNTGPETANYLQSFK